MYAVISNRTIIDPTTVRGGVYSKHTQRREAWRALDRLQKSHAKANPNSHLDLTVVLVTHDYEDEIMGIRLSRES